jgi:ABC-type transport system involved in multi-copper enzyme maturation permease subunit
MNISCKLYGFLLLAYPPEFRRRFTSEMVQVFRDSYRLETSRRSLPGFWLWTLFDLVVSVAKERKEGMIMNRNLVALLGSIGIIVIAFLLLSYGRKNEVASILMFGYVLDALVTTGVIGNLVVLILTKTAKFDPLRIALWTFAVVHAVPLLLVVLVVGRNDPRFNVTATVIGYLVSFAIWAGLHFAWRHRPPVYS